MGKQGHKTEEEFLERKTWETWQKTTANKNGWPRRKPRKFKRNFEY